MINIGDKYLLSNIIGKGSWGVIYKIYDKENNNIYAAKFEEKHNKKSLLKHESSIYEYLGNINGIPKIYKFIEFDNGNQHMLIMDLLGDTIEDKFKLKNKFSFETLFKLAMDILKIIKEIHNKNIIHRDIKPENFMFDKYNKKLYIVDFGLADYCSNEFIDNQSMVGTARYASLGAHFGHKQTRKHDLEAISYMLL